MKLNPLQQILTSLSKQEIKAVIKLISIEILDTLGDNKYLIQQGNHKLTAISDQHLSLHEKYWAVLKTDNNTTVISNLIKYPHLLKDVQYLSNILQTDKLDTILKKQNPIEALKDVLLQAASHATSKHQFTQISNLLLPLLQDIMTIPLKYKGHFGIFQLKKRYNKKNKKLQIDFYAAFYNLGPISGFITSLDDITIININVAFVSTKLFLEQHLKDINYTITIRLKQNIDALSDTSNNGILDVNV